MIIKTTPILRSLYNDLELNSLKERLRRIRAYASKKGIKDSCKVSYIYETAQKGIFYLKDEKCMIIFYFQGSNNKVEELSIVYVVENNSRQAKLLKRGILPKIIQLPVDVITNY